MIDATHGTTTSLRRSRPADAKAVAELLVRARVAAAGYIPPPVHSDAEIRAWVATVVLPEHEVWLAVAAPDELVAVMVLDGDWVDQLYVDPGRTGEGIGTQLIAQAKRCRPGGLQLWTFVSNVRAREFYIRNGFGMAEETDGSANEEQHPDLRFVWPAPGSASSTVAIQVGDKRLWR